jgi:hypothetical protein
MALGDKKHFTLRELDLGAGVAAVGFSVLDGAFVLVRAKCALGTFHSKLDLQKRQLLDPLPGERKAGAIDDLVKAIVAARCAAR